MKNGDSNTRHDGEEQAPHKLVAALKEPPSWRVFVPPTLDDAILRAARRHLAKPELTRFLFFRSWAVWPVTAAACLALAGLAYFATRQSTPKFAREDINCDGQVDILDAFQLARQLQTGGKPVNELDLNGDAIVDRRDVEFIAAQAVKLEKGRKS